MATRQRVWHRKQRNTAMKAAVSPTSRDLEWAAGFLEGEGSFIKANSSLAGTEMVSCPQKDATPLLRLQALFGGNLSTRPTKYSYRMNVWQVYGSRALGVMLTLYSLLTPRRQEQIKSVMLQGV